MSVLFENPYLAVLALILGFGFLIFVHELGHFLVAKWVGIRATQFAIGFGQSLVSYRKGIGVRVGSTEPEYFRRAKQHLEAKHATPQPEHGNVVSKFDVVDVEEKPHSDSFGEEQLYAAADALGLGETEYRLNWLPLGGYVKMLGQEDMDPNAMSADPRAFNRKSIGARAAVISAGVVMNLVFGMLFLIVAFSDYAGVQFAAPRVGQTIDGSPAATTYAEGHEDDADYLGLRPGDHITHVNGKPIEDMVAVRIAGALGDPGEPVELRLTRAGLNEPLTYRIVPVADEQRAEGMLAMGIQPAVTLELEEISDKDFLESWSKTPWAEAGVELGMELAAVDGETVAFYAELRRALDAAGGLPVTLTFSDSETGQSVDVPYDPAAALPRNAEGEPTLLGLIPAAAVSEVVDGKPAARAGVQAGDVIARLGDTLYPAGLNGVIDAIQAADNQPMDLEVIRDGQRVILGPITPKRSKLGLGVETALESTVLRGVAPGSPLSELNLPPGSRLVAFDGKELASFNELLRELQAMVSSDNPPASVELTFVVNLGAGAEETVTLPLDDDARAAIADAGWSPPRLPFAPDEVRIAGDTLGEAASIGLAKTGEFIQQTYITLLRLFQGSVKTKHLRGPVGIVDAGATVAARGWPYYLFFLGIISINLAVINFLPIPIVDGGLMVFLMIEKLRGKPASPAIQTAAMIVGLVLIASVFLIVTYNDIVRIITRS